MQITDNAPIEALLETIGKNINQIRLKQNISNEDLSEKSGVSRVTLSKLWKGSPVKFDTLLRVVRALGRMDLIYPLMETPKQTPMERLKETQTGKGSEETRQRARRSLKIKASGHPYHSLTGDLGSSETKKHSSLRKAPVSKPRSAKK